MTSGVTTAKLQTFPVYLVDDHDEVYSHWKELGLRNATLVHLDEHSDFQWISQNPDTLINDICFSNLQSLSKHNRRWAIQHYVHRQMHLGNYLHRVFEEGMISKWLWGVPEPLWQHAKLRNGLRNILQDLYHRRTGPMDIPNLRKKSFEFSLLNVQSYVAPFSCVFTAISKSDPIVLNIDLDFLTFQPYYTAPPPPNIFRRQIPWIWPEQLAEHIFRANIPIECAAVSNSIHGGYTPIGYKFLGEVLAAILRSEEIPAEYFPLKDALILRNQNQDDKALEILKSFESEGAVEIARAYHCAVILYEMNYIQEAKALFSQCASRDQDFASTYSSFGPIYEFWKSHADAQQEYKMIQTLMPESEDAKLGFLRSCANLGEQNWAEIKFQEHLLKHPESSSPMAYFPLAQIFLEKKNFEEAIPLLVKAITLSPNEPWFRVCLADCYYQTGALEQAKLEIREALRLGYHFPIAYKLLAKTYWKLGKKKKALELFTEFARLSLVAIVKQLRSRF